MGPFKGDPEAFVEMDSGVLFADWDRWKVAYDIFTRKKICDYEPLKLDYNKKVTAELERLMNPISFPRNF